MDGHAKDRATRTPPIRHYAPIGVVHLVMALILLGCAAPSLMPPKQAAAVRERERALAPHVDAIQAAIAEAERAGALAFLDPGSGRLVVLPGDSPAEAWERGGTDGALRATAPPVLTFVHRVDVPRAPQAVTLTDLEQQRELRRTVASLDAEVRGAHAQIEERLGMVQRELAAAVTASKQESDASLAAARADLQKALSALAEDLAAARKFMLQTAQLGWLNHESNVENAAGLRKVTSASQELAASSARLEETVRLLSTTLTTQLKELARKLDTIHGKVSSLQ